MRCYCCDVRLSLRESCTKFKGSGLPTEMCTHCLSTIDVDTVAPKQEFSDKDEEDEDE